MDTYAPIAPPITVPVEATAEVPPPAAARRTMASRLAGFDRSRATKWGRKAGPGMALLTAGVVIGAIVGSSWSASAVGDGTTTPTPNASVQQGLTQDGTGAQGGLGQSFGQGFGGQRGFGRGGGQMGGQMGQMPGGMTGGFGGFGQQMPGDGSTGVPSESGSPTELMTF